MQPPIEEATGAVAIQEPQLGRQEDPSPLRRIPEFVRDIFYPSALESLRDSMPAGQIRCLVHRSPTEPPQEVILTDMFPFMTLQDIKIALYLELNKDPVAIPEFTYLATHGSIPGKGYLGGKNAPVDFTWNLPTALPNQPFLNNKPFEIASGAIGLDTRFVDNNGERRIINPIYRESITIEDMFLKSSGFVHTIPEFHAYFYKDLLAAIPGARPVGVADWNGRLLPFFPFLATGTDATPTDKQKGRADRLALIFEKRQQFLVRLESLLESNVPLIPITLAGIKLLRLTWAKQKKDMPGIESQFYDAPVNADRPFMRLIPIEGTSISKVFLKDGKTPDIQNPTYLVNWAQERNPTPERNFAFAKILVRKGVSNVPSIYSTLRLFNDGTADVIVEPPKGMKKLEPKTDLDQYGEKLVEGIKGFPYLTEVPDIGNAMLVLGVRLKKGAESALSPRVLKERLPIFSGIFQEILPMPGEKPLAMLRYKLVSNFTREDRIQTFITQLISRRVLKGEALISNVADIVADEFQIDIERARGHVADKLREQGQVALVNPETKDYMLQYNPGIDIAIYAQHPFYTFHLYRVNSIENLQRIITALSILMSVRSDQIEVGEKVVRDLKRAETAEAEAVAAMLVGDAAAEEAVASAQEGEGQGEGQGQGEGEGQGAVATQEEEGDAEDLGGAEDIPDYMDFFMQGDEAEVQGEEEAAEEVQEAERKEGASYLEEAPERQGALPVPLAGPPPTQLLRRELQEEVTNPREEMQGAAEVTARAAAAAAAKIQAEAIEEEDITAGPVSIANYFIRKLQEADSRLFEYHKSHPSEKRYVTQCQPTYGRQPAVMNEEKFEQMVEEYSKDGVIFQVFPLEPGEPEKVPGGAEKEYYTVLRYGSSPQKQNYYICCQYFCIRDEIMVREDDLYGANKNKMRRPIKRRDGRPADYKEAGECPFCRGKVIKNPKMKVLPPNETIYERPTVPPAHTSRQIFINFIKRIHHPEGFYLPCCFGDETAIKYADNPAFDKYKEWGIPPKPSKFKLISNVRLGLEEDGEAAAEEEAAATEDAASIAPFGPGPRTESGYPVVDYWVMLGNITKKYIVGAEKLPLEIGTVGSQFKGEPQIGLLPLPLNTYFDQDPTTLVSRSFNPQKLKPGAYGFLRIAVENRIRNQNDSLLSVLAPFYYLNTAQQMKDHILNLVTPRIFLALNYGNMALEFYDPTNPLLKRPSDEELRLWASDELEVDMQQENKEALMRAYLSFLNFQVQLRSTETKKEFRQFALLAAQSRLLRREGREESRTNQGITFIVLDLTKDGKVEVRCPPYGFNADLNSRNDVAFLMHHWSGIWEPIFHVDNRTEGDRRRVQLTRLIFKRAEYASWPEIVVRRFQEYITQCSSTGRGVYTSQSRINALAMIPLSLSRRTFIKEPKIVISGVIRDSYNHLAAIILRERLATGLGPMIPLPVIDDGDLYYMNTLVLDWDDPSLEKAPADTVIRFYRKYVESNFQIYPGYKIVRVVYSRGSGNIEAVKLRNGLFVPAGPASSQEDGVKLLEFKEEVDQMEWTLNKEIVMDREREEGQEEEEDIPGEKDRMEIAEFNEIFEHLRLTFSNWLATKEDSGKFREVLEDTIFSKRLPLFEKRKRLEILLAPQVERWITTDFSDEDKKGAMQTSLLRTDCRLRKEEGTCKGSGRCVWKRGVEQEGAATGRCLLHIPEDVAMGQDQMEETRRVSAPRVLLLRLIEELLRYGERRKQLLNADVSQLATLDKPVTVTTPGKAGKQVIYPEKSVAWFQLLRLDWAKKPEEQARFLEEMSKAAPEKGPVPPITDQTKLPESLATFLGGAEDPKVLYLRLLRAPFAALFTQLGVSYRQIGVTAETVELTDEMLRKITEATDRTVAMIDIRTDEALGASKVKKPVSPRSYYPTVPVFVITEDGPALLVENPEQPAFLRIEAMPTVLKRVIG